MFFAQRVEAIKSIESLIKSTAVSVVDISFMTLPDSGLTGLKYRIKSLDHITAADTKDAQDLLNGEIHFLYKPFLKGEIRNIAKQLLQRSN